MATVVRWSPAAKHVIVCVDAAGKETKMALPKNRKEFAPTLAMLRSAFWKAFACVEWESNPKSRVGLSEEDHYGS